jgi:hypothetical protein
VVVDITFSEGVVVTVFIAILILLAVYSFELGSAMLAFSTSKLMLASILRCPIELWPAPLRRVMSLRSRRWVVGDKDRPPEPDWWYSSIEGRAVRRRRLVRYIMNALKYRDKFGFIGKTPYSTGPIKPKLELWEWLLNNFDIVPHRESMETSYIRKSQFTKYADNPARRAELAETLE